MAFALAPGVAVIVPEPQMVVLEPVGAAGIALMVSVTGNRAAVLSQLVTSLKVVM
jgi:hypothetical protein